MTRTEKIMTGLNNPLFAFNELVANKALRPTLALFSDIANIGTNMFSKDWDLLILLDTCRIDALETVQDRYKFIGNIESVTSVGSTSQEWIAKTFTKTHIKDIEKTAYLTHNTYPEIIFGENQYKNKRRHNLRNSILESFDTVSADDFAHLEHTWKYEPIGEKGPETPEYAPTPSRYLTDRVITTARDNEFERIIIHYLSPHMPYTTAAIEQGRDPYEYEKNPFKFIRETGKKEEVWKSYLEELRYVLEEVKLLLNNIDAEKVIISSDHGEAFGEYGIYGHPMGSLFSKLRKVPWVETTAIDNETHSPSTLPPEEGMHITENSVEQTLKSLGYKI